MNVIPAITSGVSLAVMEGWRKKELKLISCAKCGLEYVEETSNSLRNRLNQHRSDIRWAVDTAVANYFNTQGHTNRAHDEWGPRVHGPFLCRTTGQGRRALGDPICLISHYDHVDRGAQYVQTYTTVCCQCLGILTFFTLRKADWG